MTRKNNPFTIERIKHILEITGWTQQRLGHACGFDGQNANNLVSRWLNNLATPDKRNQNALSQIETRFGIIWDIDKNKLLEIKRKWERRRDYIMPPKLFPHLRKQSTM